MRDSTKRRLAIGFLIGAAVFLIAGVYFLVSGVRWHRKVKSKEHVNLLELSADLSTAGEYKGRFVDLEKYAHATWVFIDFDQPVGSQAEMDSLIAQVKGRWQAVAPDGKPWLDEEFLCWDFLLGTPYPQKRFKLFRLHDEPKGDSQLTLTITDPSATLAEKSYRIVAEYEYCGLEYLMATVPIAMGIGLCLFSLGSLAAWAGLKHHLAKKARAAANP